VELEFGPSVSDPLKPLIDEMDDGKLGSFTVDRFLNMNPTTEPNTLSPSTITEPNTLSPSPTTKCKHVKFVDQC